MDCLGLKICLDSQYSFAVSYDLTNRIELQQVVYELGAGSDGVYVLAVNANIREEGFTAIMVSSTFAAVPFPLGVPSFEGAGSFQQDIGILKKIRQQVGLSS